MPFRWTNLLPPLVFILVIAGAFFLLDELAEWLGMVPGTAVVWEHRWWCFGVVSVVGAIVYVIVERRRACPACGVRGFARVYYRGARDYREETPWYAVRQCRACGIRQVECDRGKQRLSEKGWWEEAGIFAGRWPPPKRGFEVIQDDDSPRNRGAGPGGNSNLEH